MTNQDKVTRFADGTPLHPFTYSRHTIVAVITACVTLALLCFVAFGAVYFIISAFSSSSNAYGDEHTSVTLRVDGGTVTLISGEGGTDHEHYTHSTAIAGQATVVGGTLTITDGASGTYHVDGVARVLAATPHVFDQPGECFIDTNLRVTGRKRAACVDKLETAARLARGEMRVNEPRKKQRSNPVAAQNPAQ